RRVRLQVEDGRAPAAHRQTDRRVEVACFCWRRVEPLVDVALEGLAVGHLARDSVAVVVHEGKVVQYLRGGHAVPLQYRQRWAAAMTSGSWPSNASISARRTARNAP